MIRRAAASTGNTRPGSAISSIGAIITTLLLSGCANVFQGDDGGGGGGGTDGPGARLYDHAAGVEDVLVSITSGGGFVPVEYNLRNLPQFLLLGDGTAIVGGVTIAIYPGPALQPLQSAILSEGQIQELFTVADDAGLLAGEIDFGEPPVADAPTTTVEISVDGRTVTQSAYALDFSDDPSFGLSEAEMAARAGLQSFIETAQGMVGSASAGYEPNGVVVYRLGPYEGPPADEPELDQPPQTWPIETAPAVPTTTEPGAATCVVVSGPEVPTLLAALAEANELTPWLIGSDPPARMVFRPLLPGDPGCAG
ncbi:MAG: hypothetical protein M3400_07285 [Actinomycetota bacterium]|nr:hypothetical protein [Actinomycetota bacterium]